MMPGHSIARPRDLSSDMVIPSGGHFHSPLNGKLAIFEVPGMT